MTHLSEKIVISPTSRQEGHAELIMEVDDEGIVTNGKYFSITPVRGLEKMVTGKAPESAPVLCQRICGVCPVPHTMASAEAMDAALGIEIPKAAALLRELIIASSNLNSHAIHHFLVAPDLIPADDVELFKAAVDSVSEIRKTAQYAVDMIAGEGIHPSDIRIGGLARNISELARRKLYARFNALVPKVNAHVELIENLVLEKEFPKGLGVVNAPVFASDIIYGKNDFFDLDRFTEIVPEVWYDDPEVGKRACTTIPLYDGVNVETGPRARMEKFQGVKDKGVIAQHVARADEMLKNYDACLEALDALDTSAPANISYDKRGTGELGFGVIEGPEGVILEILPALSNLN